MDEDLQVIFDKVKTALNSSTIADSIISDTLMKLKSFGYTATDADVWMISFSIQKVENTIRNSCNITLIPEGLHHVAVNMICGEFLFAKKQSGQLEGFDLDMIVKSVQTGDTNVSFAIGDGSVTPEKRLDSLINYLIGSGEDEFTCYRKINW